MAVPFLSDIEVRVASGGKVLGATDGTASVGIYYNSGTPEGAVTANPGALCLDYTNGDVYKKGSGVGTNTGWAVLASGGGATNISVANATETTFDILSDTGTDATVPQAVASSAALAGDGTAGALGGDEQFKLDQLTVTQPVDLDAMETDISEHQTVLGVADGSTDLGTFTGTTISDNVVIKVALQELESALEAPAVLANGQIFVGNASNQAAAVAVSGDATIDNAGAVTVVSASDTVAGKVELATGAEVLAGADTARAVTAAGVDGYFTSLVGNATGVQNLGTFTGTTISDNGTVKAGMQELETAVEGKLSNALTSGQILVGDGTNVAAAVAMSGDATISNTGVVTVVSASDTVAGKVELSTDAEVAAGTSTALAITPANLDSINTTLIGNATGTQHLGAFTGSTITDNVSVKVALQELETALEGIVSGLTFAGTWDATTADPTAGMANNSFLRVSVAGTTSITTVNLGAKADWQVGDFLLKDNAGNVHAIDNTDAPIDLGVAAITNTTLNVTNTSGGAAATIPAAVASSAAGAADGSAGVLSGDDKYKLDNIGNYQETYGDGATTAFTITHNLGSTDVHVSVLRVADGVEVFPQVARNAANTLAITHSIAPAASEYRVVVSLAS